jgi:CHAT domain-containing protein/tetratricopeptide (TPR) repeat protein
LLAALEILKKSLGQDHPNVGRLQNNLGGLYWVMGNYPKAEIFYLEALEILKKALGEDHADIGASLNALGILYKNMGNYPKAEHFYKKALEIKKKALDQNHPDLGTALNNLGNLYIDMENYIKAESLCLRAFEIWKKALGQDHPDVGPSLLNLGNLYSQMGIYPKAEPFYIEALKIRKRSLGEDHLDVKSTIESLACFFWHWGKQKKATPSFLEQQKITKRLIQNYFPYWSDTEKEKFYESQIISENEHFQSFCADQNAANPQLSSEAFNSLLFYKGLLLSNSFKWKQRIRNSKDSTLKTRFEAWEGLANRISKLISSTDSAELAELKELQIEAETIEKELVQKSEAFATMTDKNTYTWKDVQAKLKPGEAAIEMVRVRKKGIEKIVTDTSDQKKPTYYVKGLSDTAYYAAYIVKSSSIYPELVLLKNGNDLEGKWKEYYQNTIRRRVPDSYSYSQFWKPISDKLGQKVKRVYFSPDGIYNSINLNTLQNPKTGEYLLDEKDIRMVTNTKDLVTASNAKPNADYACLVGYPEYNADKSLRAEVVNRERKAPESWYHLNLSRSDVFAELPGTKTEVENISGIISGKGWKVEMLLGEKALEDRVKEVEMPRILHIATHGYFQPDTTKGQNALLRSGLLLTGANKTLAGEKSEDLEDGILTAYEAMNLNLDNTDLVVLSACETGLGEIKNGEGVYGLQRAFKVAGAKSIIMSLWKVSDQATQELMVSFYKNWLGSEIVGTAKSGHSASGQQAVWPKAPTAGTTKRAAFLKAQKVLKVKYPDPYFWGAFVMVGE